MKGLKVILCFILVSVSIAKAAQIHFEKLEEVLPSIKTAFVAKVIEVKHINPWRYEFLVEISKTIKGNAPTSTTSLVFNVPKSVSGDVIKSPLMPASGLEWKLEEDKSYIFLLRDEFYPHNSLTSLTRAEPLSKKELIKKYLEEN